jgi:hypothetical protein
LSLHSASSLTASRTRSQKGPYFWGLGRSQAPLQSIPALGQSWVGRAVARPVLTPPQFCIHPPNPPYIYIAQPSTLAPLVSFQSPSSLSPAGPNPAPALSAQVHVLHVAPSAGASTCSGLPCSPGSYGAAGTRPVAPRAHALAPGARSGGAPNLLQETARAFAHEHTCARTHTTGGTRAGDFTPPATARRGLTIGSMKPAHSFVAGKQSPALRHRERG